jgi:hypothetical protein
MTYKWLKPPCRRETHAIREGGSRWGGGSSPPTAARSIEKKRDGGRSGKKNERDKKRLEEGEGNAPQLGRRNSIAACGSGSMAERPT